MDYNILFSFKDQHQLLQLVFVLKFDCKVSYKLVSQLIEERNRLTIPASKLDELIRNHQVAEATFSSALARIDTSKADVFVSYPLVQLLDMPSLPESPSSPKKLFVVLGAVFSSLFSMSATGSWE